MKNWKSVVLVGMLISAIISIIWGNSTVQDQATTNYCNALTLGILMVVLWLTEAIPIYITALIPWVLGVPLGLIDSTGLSQSYGDKMVYLFFGGFVLATALEKWKIHLVVANAIINRVGHSKPRILIGFLFATGFLSMWVSNTATALMMLPMAVAIIELMPKAERKGRFSIYLLLSVAYGANIGGMATLVGSPPNLQMASLLEKQFETKVGFAEWFWIGFPISILMLVLTALFFYFTLGKEKHEQVEGFQAEKHKLNKDQWRILIVFTLVVLGWIFKDIIAGKTGFFPNFKLSDEITAIAGAIVLLLLPSHSKEHGKTLLTWNDVQSIPWGILIMFGGGMALASCMDYGGVIQSIALIFDGVGDAGYFLLLCLMVVIAVFGTELLSNLALVTLFVPIIAVFSAKNGFDLVSLCIPLTLASSCGFMMPVGTPPNAIAYSSGYISMPRMLKNGLIINIIGILVIIGFSTLYYGVFK
ncbi:MAG: SLC13 family permease [Fluviicola sp.]